MTVIPRSPEAGIKGPTELTSEDKLMISIRRYRLCPHFWLDSVVADELKFYGMRCMMGHESRPLARLRSSSSDMALRVHTRHTRE